MGYNKTKNNFLVKTPFNLLVVFQKLISSNFICEFFNSLSLLFYYSKENSTVYEGIILESYVMVIVYLFS